MALQVLYDRLDEHRIAGALGAEVQGVAAAGVVHIDVSAIEKQRLALLGVAQRRMATLVGEVIGLGLDDAGGKPQVALAVANDLAQQGFGQGLGVAVEKAVWQCWHARASQAKGMRVTGATLTESETFEHVTAQGRDFHRVLLPYG